MSNTDDIVRHGEQVEASVWRDIWDAAPSSVREAMGLSYEHVGIQCAIRANSVPNWFFNRVVGLGLDGAARPEDVDRWIAPYRRAGVPFGVSLAPTHQPGALVSWLEERGLAKTTTLARMVRDTSNLPAAPSELRVLCAGREDADAFGDTVVRGFGLPPVARDWMSQLCLREGWRTYLAYKGDTPVAAGALRVEGTTGWLGFGCTLPEERGRGLHRAVMLRRMHDAVDLGCRHLQTETNIALADEPTPSLDNMKRLGFRQAYQRPNYVLA